MFSVRYNSVGIYVFDICSLYKPNNCRMTMLYRSGSEHINEVVKPFDWTFTTDYKGTLLGKNEAQFRVSTVVFSWGTVVPVL